MNIEQTFRQHNAPDWIDRFIEKVRENPETGCWEWQAGSFATGYGCFALIGNPERRIDWLGN